MWITHCQPQTFLSVLILLNLTVVLHTVNLCVSSLDFTGYQGFLILHLLFPIIISFCLCSKDFLWFLRCHLGYIINGEAWLKHHGSSFLSAVSPELIIHTGSNSNTCTGRIISRKNVTLSPNVFLQKYSTFSIWDFSSWSMP